MTKKTLSVALALVLTLGIFCVPVSALDAAPTASAVLVNGKNVAFDGYLINGNNYFKLRDLAYALNGTEKQFEVGWDDANDAISLTSGQAYTAVGGEMTGKGAGTKTPAPTTSKIIKDGEEVSFTAYNIEGNNYFKLRDIGAAFDFGVEWDGARNTVVIDTGKGYAPEGTAPPQDGETNQDLVGTWWYAGSDGGPSFEHICEFNADGAFRLYSSWYSPERGGEWFFIQIKGAWREDGGAIYFTDCYRSVFGWNPPKTTWEKINDYTWHIQMQQEKNTVCIKISETLHESYYMYFTHGAVTLWKMDREMPWVDRP